MKEEILKRAMFAMPLSKEAQGSGIMSGFDMDEMEGDVDENADMEEMPPMARTPQNPEILMNTLRGDMRSVDARYMELAQMVGEEAAMETPPEVLAMLMGQMGAQQGGIGALPQAQGMMPPGAQAPGTQAPGAQMPPPDQMGAPQPAPAMPQGGIPMPQGMESAPPFSQGAEAPQGFAYGGPVESTMPSTMSVPTDYGMDYGTDISVGYAHGGSVEPATPDGMPPMHAAFGALITPAMRAAQFVGGKASQYGSAANAALGRMFMTPQGISQPYLENLRGAGGKFTAEQVQRGGNLIQPTFTQGLQDGVTRLAEQYPRLSALAGPALGVGSGAAYVSGKGGSGADGMGSDMASQIPRDTTADLVKNSVLNQPAAVSMTTEKPAAQAITVADPSRYTVTPGKTLEDMSAPSSAASDLSQISPVLAGEFGEFGYGKEKPAEKKSVADFIKDAGKKEAKEKSKMDRIRESQAEYAPLYEELLGGDKESAKINALLLLSEAGLKLASTRKPTFAMALADAASGLPRGFAAIAAQDRELGMKVKAASLQQAISDVDAQDKYAQALRLQVLKGDYDILKEQAKQGGGVTEDGGMGLRVTKTKSGTFLGTGIDPNDPSVKSAVQSRFTLRDTDNPFVENRGQAPTTIETNKDERVKLGNTLRSLDNSLSTLDNLKGVYTSAYGPGAWFSDKVNNLLVPVDPTGLVRPNFDTADAATRISTGMNSLLKNIASANDGGRVAVQEQEWVRETAKGISNPTAFFSDKELAAKQFGSTEAMLRNARQQVLTQLGYEGNDYVMNTPNTGTKNDPFVIPTSPEQQKTMFTFLGSTVGKLQDPRATVHLRMPNGTVQQFNPTQLRALNQ